MMIFQRIPCVVIDLKFDEIIMHPGLPSGARRPLIVNLSVSVRGDTTRFIEGSASKPPTRFSAFGGLKWLSLF